MPRKSQDRLLDEHLHSLVAQGNHDALIELEKRYRKHSHYLVNQLLTQYPSTGITPKELISVCDSHFLFVLLKFNPLLHSSLLTFWKESTKNCAMDYLIDNSYNAGAFSFRGVFSLDESNKESLCFGEVIAERDDEKINKRMIFETKSQLYKFKSFFTDQEFSLVNLILNGYSFHELEHGGMMSRTTLYLTFKNATNKLKNLIKKDQENSQ